MDWWTTTFSETFASVFHRLFPEPTQQEVDSIMRWFPLSSHPTILDLACGEGRHSIALAEQGYKVTGVDQSHAFLTTANQRTLTLLNPPTFLEQDMRSLTLTDTFNLILLIGNSFGYGKDEDQQAVLEQVSQHLAPHGSFLLALPNGLRSMCAFKDKETIERKYELDNEELTVKETYTFDATTCIKSSEWSITKQNKIIYQQETHVRFYTAPEITRMLQAVNLEPEFLYGNYKGEVFTKTSPTLLVVAHKK